MKGEISLPYLFFSFVHIQRSLNLQHYHNRSWSVQFVLVKAPTFPAFCAEPLLS